MLIAGVPLAHAGAPIIGKVQPGQSGEVKVPFAELASGCVAALLDPPPLAPLLAAPLDAPLLAPELAPLDAPLDAPLEAPLDAPLEAPPLLEPPPLPPWVLLPPPQAAAHPATHKPATNTEVAMLLLVRRGPTCVLDRLVMAMLPRD